MNKKTAIFFLLVIGVLSLASFLLIRYLSPRAVTLDAVEVRSYEGKDLSSVTDFKENSIRGPQLIEKKAYRLKVKGLAGEEKSFTYDEVVKSHPAYKKVVTLNCVEGWSVTILWEGLLVRDLIDPAKIPAEANTIIFRAQDGYSTSFPLE